MGGTRRAYPVNEHTHYIQIPGGRPIRLKPKMGGHAMERCAKPPREAPSPKSCCTSPIGHRLKGLAPGLTPRSLFEKFAAVQMFDVHIPTTDGRELQLTRYTQPEPEPEPELMLLPNRLRLELPNQPPPKITAAEAAASADLRGMATAFSTR